MNNSMAFYNPFIFAGCILVQELRRFPSGKKLALF